MLLSGANIYHANKDGHNAINLAHSDEISGYISLLETKMIPLYTNDDTIYDIENCLS